MNLFILLHFAYILLWKLLIEWINILIHYFTWKFLFIEVQLTLDT